MAANTIIMIVLIVATLFVVAGGIYHYLRNKSLDEIREDVYQLFLEAEHRYTENGTGKQKMEWVVSKARLLLPGWAQIIITEELLYIVIEGWFRAIKDLLDDGKYNSSVK